MLSTECVKTPKMPSRLPKILLSKSTSWVVRGKKFLIQTRQAQKFSSLIGSFDLDYLQSWGRNQRFWSLHPSLGPAVPHEWVASVRVGMHHSALCLLNQKFLSILTWCWLGLLFSRICRMGWLFQPSRESKFCNSLWAPDSAATLFSFWDFSKLNGSISTERWSAICKQW